jgi:LacI family transcriptional regulator
MREGYLGALDRSDFENGCLLTADFTSGGGYRAMKAVLAAGIPFDGLFTTDEMAFGAIRAMKEKGLRIPEDVKVMGCDGMELGKELTPALSTVLLNRQVLSERAVSRLADLMNSPDQPVERVLLAPKLEMRGTCVP